MGSEEAKMSNNVSYTPEEVANILKISRYTVYEMIKRGELSAYRIGRKLRIEASDIEKYKQLAKSECPAAKNEASTMQIQANADVKGALIICGQDAALDILSRHLQNQKPGLRVLRTFDGSMNGLLALYNRTANVVTAHLWDGDSDDYNVPYVRRVLPGHKTEIYNLLYRNEGFYVAKGNPKNIKNWNDLTKPGVKFVNRELGSGARVLLDEKLRRLGIDRQLIKGYEQEKTSHFAVASAVARGECDVGLGIEKVALQVDDIDFIPLQRERLDIIMRKEDMAKSEFQLLVNILRSDSFKKEIAGMGGYDVSHMGELVAET